MTGSALTRVASVGLVAALAAAGGIPAASATAPITARATTATGYAGPTVMQRDYLDHAGSAISLPPDPGLPRAGAVVPRAATPRGAAPRAAARAGYNNASLGREVLGFAPYWALAAGTLDELRYQDLSTIAYFGLTLDGAGNLAPGNGMTGWNSAALSDVITRAHGAGDRVVLTAICFSNADINAIVSNPGTGQNAINSIINAVRQRGLDGVNVDFEGAAGSYPNIQQNYTAWVGRLAQQLRGAVPGAQVTVDAYASSAGSNDGFMRIDTLAPYVDAFFVMDYDITAGGANPPPALPNAPLTGPYTYNSYSVVDQFISAAGSTGKVILGVPYYGYKFSTTTTDFNSPLSGHCGSAWACSDTYADARSDLACAQGLATHWDQPSQTPWAAWFSPASGDPCGGNHNTYRELYYDDATSIGLKYDLVNSRGLRGTGMWALGNDRGYPDLWQAIETHIPRCAGAAERPLRSAMATAEVAAMAPDCSLWVRQGSAAWTPLGGLLGAAPAVAAGAPGSGSLYLATGIDGNLYVRSERAGWAPLNIDRQAVCIDSPAATTIGSTLHVACKGVDQALWYTSATLGTGLPQVRASSWQSLGGVLAAGPAVVAVNGAPLYIVPGTDSFVYTRNASSGWHGQPWRCSGHVAAALSGTSVYFACQGLDRALWYSTWNGSKWTAATSLGGVLVDGPGIAATPGGPVFYAEGDDGQVWQTGTTPAWSSLGGLVVHGVGAGWIA